MELVNKLDSVNCSSLAFVTGQSEGQHILSAFHSKKVRREVRETTKQSKMKGRKKKTERSNNTREIWERQILKKRKNHDKE